MVRQSWNAMVNCLVRKTPVRLRRPMRSHLATPIEVVEARCLLSSTLLGTAILQYDPTPALPNNNDTVDIGTVTFTRTTSTGPDTDVISVTFQIDAAHQADYDLSMLETTVNSGSLGQVIDSGLPAGTESFTQEVYLPVPLPANTPGLSIEGCATIIGPTATGSPTVAAIGEALPSIGTVNLFNGNTIAPSSYFDSIVTPGWIPSSTATADDTLAFSGSPNWQSGDAVRVVAMSGASSTTGLITPLTNGNTTAVAYYVHDVGGGEYSFHLNRADALSGANPVDITDTVPQTGEIIVAAENDALAYLGQVPSSQTANTLSFDQPHGWADRTLVRVAVGMGGLTANTNYYVEVVDATTVKLHMTPSDVNVGPGVTFTETVSALISPMFNGWCVDFDRPADVGREQIVNIYSSYETSGFPNTSFDYKSDAGPENGRSTASVLLTPSGNLADRLVFSSNHGLANGTAVRVTTDSDTLLAANVYYTRGTGNPTTLFLYDTRAHALAGGPTGRVTYSGTDTVSTALYRATTVTFSPAVNWPTGSRVRLTANDGGLNTATDYYVRNLSSGATYSFYASRADAQNNANPIVFSDPIDSTTTIYVKENLVERPENFDMVNWILNQSFQTQTSPSDSALYSMGDIEAAIWTLLENNPPTVSHSGPAAFTPAHVSEIVALATAAVGGRIDQGTDDFIPGAGQVVAIVMQPIGLLGQTTAQVTIAEIPTADIPGYWQYEDCHSVFVNTLQEFNEPTLVTTASPSFQLGDDLWVLKDTALLEEGLDPTGTITFDLYAPGGGLPIHSETVTVNGNGEYSTPTGYTLPIDSTVVGTYTWVATYSGDDNNTAAEDQGGPAEQTTVSQAEPELTTVASPSSITLGDNVSTVLMDTAQLTGGYYPTGTITFVLLGPDGVTEVYEETVEVNGNGEYSTAVGYTLPTEGSVVGTYTWVATYSGDGNNISAKDQGGESEQIAVTPSSPSITTVASDDISLTDGLVAILTDTATLTGGYYPTGQIKFELYDPNGTVVDTEYIDVDGNGSYTTPEGYELPTTGSVVGTYKWVATYLGDDNNSEVVDSSGVLEEIVVSPAQPTLITQAGGTVTISGGSASANMTDTAQLTGGYYPTGTITFSLYNPLGTVVYTTTATVNGNGNYSTGTGYTPSSTDVAGTYTWVATYTSSTGNNLTAKDQGGAAEQQVLVNNSNADPRTIGFWRSPNGQAILLANDTGPNSWRSIVNSLYLRKANGTQFTVSTTASFATAFNSFKSWLQGANATNMAYMLSAQLIAMKFNVAYKGVDANVNLFIGTGSPINSWSGNGQGSNLRTNFDAKAAIFGQTGTTNGNITLAAVMADAEYMLQNYGTATTAGDARTFEESLKIVLDAANNNVAIYA